MPQHSGGKGGAGGHVTGDPRGGSGGAGSGSSGARGGYDRLPEQFNARIVLMDQNGSIGGVEGQHSWVCLGVIPQIHPDKNVWLQRC